MENKCRYINRLLLADTQNVWKSIDYPLAFCVHSSIIKNWENLLRTLFIRVMQKVGYTLQVGNHNFNMYLIYVKLNNVQDRLTLIELITNSQFSMPWLNNPNVFIRVESFHIIEEFIKNHNLDEYILTIDEMVGISLHHKVIKVVTFHQSVNVLNIIHLYNKHIKSTKACFTEPNYYFVTFAFAWLKPHCQEHYNIPVSDDFYFAFFIILNHLSTLKYANNLNIFDLLSIRLALFNFRSHSRTCLRVKYEIDYMIKRQLDKIVKNNQLDIDKYAVDQNVSPHNFLFDYLVYEFQNHFETINHSIKMHQYPALTPIKVKGLIELAHEIDVLNQIKAKHNVEFDIDGMGYVQMNLSLFLDLVECHNVRSILFDTNQTWLTDVCNLKRSITNPDDTMRVTLLGTNTHNFIEEFVSSLKTVNFTNGIIVVHIYCNLYDYTIFDDLSVHWIKLYNIKVDTRMLRGLSKCNLKSKIMIYDGTFENEDQNWELLHNLNKSVFAEIIEDEDTWQSMFEFVRNELLKPNSKEFKFAPKNFTILSDGKNVHLNKVSFSIDELNFKLILRDQQTGKIIDLFDLKCDVAPDDRSNFEFYQ